MWYVEATLKYWIIYSLNSYSIWFEDGRKFKSVWSEPFLITYVLSKIDTNMYTCIFSVYYGSNYWSFQVRSTMHTVYGCMTKVITGLTSLKNHLT